MKWLRRSSDEAKSTKKPVIACFMGLESIGQARVILHQNHVPLFDYPEKIGRVAGSLLQYAHIQKIQERWKKVFQLMTKNRQKVQKIFENSKNQIIFGEADTRPILQEYGIPLGKR